MVSATFVPTMNATSDALHGCLGTLRRGWGEGSTLRIVKIDGPQGNGDARIYVRAGDGSVWTIHCDRYGNELSIDDLGDQS